MKMITLPSLLKQPMRFSERHRPTVVSIVVYSHAIQLLLSEFVPETQDIGRDEVFNGAEVEVIRNSEHIVEVLFNGAKQTDLVSPEFLTTGELTKAGELILQHKGLLVETRKMFLEFQRA